jgi:broad specificity phosphatase PhoE
MDEYLSNPHSADMFEGVETLAALHARAEKVLKILQQESANSILVVSHGAFGRSLFKVVQGKKYDEVVDSIDNAKIIRLM